MRRDKKWRARIERIVSIGRIVHGLAARIGTTRFRHDGVIDQMAWSPDGKYIASAAGRSVVIWDAATGHELARPTIDDREFPPAFPPKVGLPFKSRFAAIEWSPDGKQIATGFNNSAQLWTWDGPSNRLAFQRKFAEKTGVDDGGVLWADAQRVITGSGSQLTITDLPKQTTLGTLALPNDGFSQIAVQFGGTAVAVAGDDDKGRLLIFDWMKPDNQPLDLGAEAERIAFSRDGKTFAAITVDAKKNLAVGIWDATTWKSRLRFPYPKPVRHAITPSPFANRPGIGRAFALSANGKTLVTGDDDRILRFWDTTTGNELRKLGESINCNKAAFRPDGKVLMTASHENHVRLWEVESRKRLEITSDDAGPFGAIAITPDGKRIICVTARTYAFDAATGRELWRTAEDLAGAGQVVITPDGKTAITSGDSSVNFLEIGTGKLVRKIETPRGSAGRLVRHSRTEIQIESGETLELGQFQDPGIRHQRLGEVQAEAQVRRRQLL